MTDGLCVVHLVRVGEPVGSLRRFIDSYTAHSAGAEHRLVLLFKGFEADRAALAPYRSAAEDVDHDELQVSDHGFDLTAYRAGAESLRSGCYCFLNSHSEILMDGWLGLLRDALEKDGVGVAGATGSWASQASLARLLLRLPGPYSGLLDRVSVTRVLDRLQGAGLESDDGTPVEVSAGSGRVAAAAAMLRSVPHALRLTAAVSPFPAAHLRTNAFLVRHRDFVGLDGFAATTKLQAHAAEGGRRSMTRQLSSRGLRAVVVDRAGNVHDSESWPRSDTFWQGHQQGLIVADNQTKLYQRADAESRLTLSRLAWGALADTGELQSAGREGEAR